MRASTCMHVNYFKNLVLIRRRDSAMSSSFPANRTKFDHLYEIGNGMAIFSYRIMTLQFLSRAESIEARNH